MLKIERFPSGRIKSVGADIPFLFNSALDNTAAFYIAVILIAGRVLGVL